MVKLGHRDIEMRFRAQLPPMSSRRQRFGGQLTGADGVVPKPVVAVVKAVATPIPAEEDGEEVCFICASAVPLWGVGECSHRTCSTCAIRLRAL